MRSSYNIYVIDQNLKLSLVSGYINIIKLRHSDHQHYIDKYNILDVYVSYVFINLTRGLPQQSICQIIYSDQIE